MREIKLENLSISEEDWNRTPPSVQRLVLWQREQIKALEVEMQALKELLGQNSKNSSRPLSTDPDYMQKPKRKPSFRPRGGQFGHEGKTRTLLPIEKVKEVIPVKPKNCKRCGNSLFGEDKSPFRHQVTEIPPVVAYTVEYQLHTLSCLMCGAANRAELPEGVPKGVFGPRLQAMVCQLSGQYHLSKRNIEAIMEDFFQAYISLGSVKKIEQEMSSALEEPVEKVKEFFKEQKVVNLDETGWKEKNGRAWLFVKVCEVATIFSIRERRSMGGEQGFHWRRFHGSRRNRQIFFPQLDREKQKANLLVTS